MFQKKNLLLKSSMKSIKMRLLKLKIQFLKNLRLKRIFHSPISGVMSSNV